MQRLFISAIHLVLQCIALHLGISCLHELQYKTCTRVYTIHQSCYSCKLYISFRKLYLLIDSMIFTFQNTTFSILMSNIACFYMILNINADIKLQYHLYRIVKSMKMKLSAWLCVGLCVGGEKGKSYKLLKYLIYCILQ